MKKTDLEIIRRYEKIRKSGKYNMVTESDKVMKEAGLTKEEYWYAIKNYDKLILMLDDCEDYNLG